MRVRTVAFVITSEKQYMILVEKIPLRFRGDNSPRHKVHFKREVYVAPIVNLWLCVWVVNQNKPRPWHGPCINNRVHAVACGMNSLR